MPERLDSTELDRLLEQFKNDTHPNAQRGWHRLMADVLAASPVMRLAVSEPEDPERWDGMS